MRDATILAACFGLSVLGAAVAFGCASAPADQPDYDLADNAIVSGKKQDGGSAAAANGAAAADDETDDGTPAVPANLDPVDPGPPPGDPPAEANADAGAPKATPVKDAGAPAGPVTKTASCTSTYGSQRSVSKLTWVVTGTKVLIKTLNVTVTNSYGRNLNDVDVWVEQPGGTEYKAFNSGDVLASGRAVNVGLPANWTKPLNTLIRIETNYDQSGSDPSASCTIATKD